MKRADKVRAKQIICALIRENGGDFASTTKLFKAFWAAHVEYARTEAKNLTRWPIVRLPYGPGIDDFDSQLLSEMLREDMVCTETFTVPGPGDETFTGTRFRLSNGADCDELDSEELAAIKKGVKFVKGKSARAVSNESHELSREWNTYDNGKKVDVFIDLIDEDEFKARKKLVERHLSETTLNIR